MADFLVTSLGSPSSARVAGPKITNSIKIAGLTYLKTCTIGFVLYQALSFCKKICWASHPNLAAVVEGCGILRGSAREALEKIWSKNSISFPDKLLHK